MLVQKKYFLIILNIPLIFIIIYDFFVKTIQIFFFFRIKTDIFIDTMRIRKQVELNCSDKNRNRIINYLVRSFRITLKRWLRSRDRFHGVVSTLTLKFTMQIARRYNIASEKPRFIESSLVKAPREHDRSLRCCTTVSAPISNGFYDLIGIQYSTFHVVSISPSFLRHTSLPSVVLCFRFSSFTAHFAINTPSLPRCVVQ